MLQDGQVPQIQRAADVGRQAWAPSAAGVSGLEKVTLLSWLSILALLQYGSPACTQNLCHCPAPDTLPLLIIF